MINKNDDITIDYKIYCTYHDESLLNEYNLKENQNFKLFYTKGEYEGISLNYAQLYFNEWVTQYYVWKHQIKSDYVGFCHYRRIFDINKNVENILQSNNIYMHEYMMFSEPLYYYFEKTGLGYSINILLNQFIKLNYPDKFNNYNKYIYDKNSCFCWKELYICKWDIFNELTNFIDSFIKYIFNTDKELYNISLDEIDKKAYELNCKNYDIFIKCHNNNTINKIFFGYPRCIAFLIEHLIGIYLNCFYMYK